MTCCIGKARIYFREPINYWLTYQLPDGSFGSVTALEPLGTECDFDQVGIEGQQYTAHFTIQWRFYDYKNEIYYDREDATWGSTGIAPLNAFIGGSNPNFCDALYAQWSNKTEGYAPSAGNWVCSKIDSFSYYLENQDKYRFKVIGTETGTEYANIGGLEECPTVISNICLMGEERYVDQLLPDQSPGGPVESSCFTQIVDGDNWFVNLTTTYKSIDNKKLRPPETRNVLYLTGLPGCPPEYRVECCGIDQCEPEEKCPPDTDCSLDCNGLVCCYKDGKVIKSFRK